MDRPTSEQLRACDVASCRRRARQTRPGYGGSVSDTNEDPACAVAHGDQPGADDNRRLVVVFTSAVGRHLLHFGRHLGYQTVLVDPAAAEAEADADAVVTTMTAAAIDATTDVVVTDHHRPELGPVLRDVLKHSPRWVGVMGSPRHIAPHIAALTELGVARAEIDRVHQPIGLNIGSRTPPEIALATLAGLIADRTGRPGGFAFDPTSRAG
jgi:xanthine dehydrogenase accessory factor